MAHLDQYRMMAGIALSHHVVKKSRFFGEPKHSASGLWNPNLTEFIMFYGGLFVVKNLEIKYTITHEWIEILDLDSGECSVGITERIQEVYGDIVFVDLPQLDEYEQGEIIGRIETSDGQNHYIHAPISGEVYDINTALEDDIELLNQFPEGDGWICKFYMENPSEIDSLLSLREYETHEEDELNEEEYLPETDFYENIEDY